MNQMEYDAWRKRYARRQGDAEDSLPHSLSFRIRLILCLGLFLFFLFAEKNVLTAGEKEKIFAAMEQNVAVRDWKEYVENVYSSIK